MGKAGAIEINTLIIWIVLLVFLIIVFIIIMMTKGQGDSAIGGICAKTGGLVGCT